MIRINKTLVLGIVLIALLANCSTTENVPLGSDDATRQQRVDSASQINAPANVPVYSITDPPAPAKPISKKKKDE